jgi:hypothetical protein
VIGIPKNTSKLGEKLTPAKDSRGNHALPERVFERSYEEA